MSEREETPQPSPVEPDAFSAFAVPLKGWIRQPRIAQGAPCARQNHRARHRQGLVERDQGRAPDRVQAAGAGRQSLPVPGRAARKTTVRRCARRVDGSTQLKCGNATRCSIATRCLMNYLPKSPTTTHEGTREPQVVSDVPDVVQAGKGDLSDWLESMDAMSALCSVWAVRDMARVATPAGFDRLRKAEVNQKAFLQTTFLDKGAEAGALPECRSGAARCEVAASCRQATLKPQQFQRTAKRGRRRHGFSGTTSGALARGLQRRPGSGICMQPLVATRP